ncbi:MAG: DUF6789 family protein [Candidatus Dormibacteria bacterium]
MPRTSLSPAVRGVRDIPLLLICLLSALSSIAALLLHAAGLVRMPFTVSFLTVPGLILLAGLTIWTGRTDRRLFFNRLTVGLAAGAAGLVAYDAIRFVVGLFPIHFDPFFSHRAFGNLMTGAAVMSPTALWAGWAYHITNGVTFGVIYCLLAGPARWWYGLIWGTTLELAMLLVYAPLFHPNNYKSFVLVSIVGHAAFGTIVGVISRRYSEAANR